MKKCLDSFHQIVHGNARLKALDEIYKISNDFRMIFEKLEKVREEEVRKKNVLTLTFFFGRMRLKGAPRKGL